VDHQVKVRGYRIELGEIEAALMEQQSVRQCVVVVREDEPGEKRLVAYLVGEGAEAVPGASELRSVLKERLPEYMMPTAFVLMESLPLTPNGKVDRRALPKDERGGGQEKALVAPRNAVEEELARIWREVLGVEEISVNDNFFEMGGHSLLAVRLMARVARQWGKALPLATLFQDGTIERMALLLSDAAEPACWSPLVALKSSGTKRPFFCVHPVGGHVLCYAPLTSHWDAERPLYGLQARGLEEGQDPAAHIEEMAHDYVGVIRSVQPEGPYLLGGWSVGGVIAFEMARQLEAQKQEVSLLALFDSKLPRERRAPLDELSQLVGFARDLGLDVDNTDVPRDEFVRMNEDERHALLLEGAKRARILPQDFTHEAFLRLYRVFKTNLRALYDYAPQPYAGQLTLLSASEQTRETPAAQRNGHPALELNSVETEKIAPSLPDFVKVWEQLATGGVEWSSIPGNHYTIVREPNVGTLAVRLMNRMQNLEED
jgi:thioesterase domain-containing protein/aryl carrier-like protein